MPHDTITGRAVQKFRKGCDVVRIHPSIWQDCGISVSVGVIGPDCHGEAGCEIEGRGDMVVVDRAGLSP